MRRATLALPAARALHDLEDTLAATLVKAAVVHEYTERPRQQRCHT